MDTFKITTIQAGGMQMDCLAKRRRWIDTNFADHIRFPRITLNDFIFFGIKLVDKTEIISPTSVSSPHFWNSLPPTLPQNSIPVSEHRIDNFNCLNRPSIKSRIKLTNPSPQPKSSPISAPTSNDVDWGHGHSHTLKSASIERLTKSDTKADDLSSKSENACSDPNLYVPLNSSSPSYASSFNNFDVRSRLSRSRTASSSFLREMSAPHSNCGDNDTPNLFTENGYPNPFSITSNAPERSDSYSDTALGVEDCSSTISEFGWQYQNAWNDLADVKSQPTPSLPVETFKIPPLPDSKRPPGRRKHTKAVVEKQPEHESTKEDDAVSLYAE